MSFCSHISGVKCSNCYEWKEASFPIYPPYPFVGHSVSISEVVKCPECSTYWRGLEHSCKNIVSKQSLFDIPSIKVNRDFTSGKVTYFVRKRGAGKTTEMINWMLRERLKDNYPILIVFSQAEAKRLYDYCVIDLGVEFNRSQFVSYDNLSKVKNVKNIVIGIDELESFLYKLIGFNVNAISISY